MRILVGNDPRLYREVISAVLGVRRPDAEVACAEPRELDTKIARLAPHLVVCSRLTKAIRSCALGWVVLYPDGDDHALVTIAGTSTRVKDIQLDELLVIIDHVQQILHVSPLPRSGIDPDARLGIPLS